MDGLTVGDSGAFAKLQKEHAKGHAEQRDRKYVQAVSKINLRVRKEAAVSFLIQVSKERMRAR